MKQVIMVKYVRLAEEVCWFQHLLDVKSS